MAPTALVHPLSPQALANPYPSLAAFRRISPAYFDRGMNLYLLTSYEWCRAALRDPAFSAAAGQQQRLRTDDLPISMLTTDGELHVRLRTPATAAFAARATDRLAEPLADVAADLLGRLPLAGAGTRIELVTALAQPYAAAVLGTVLELPPRHWPEFALLAAAASANLDPTVRGDQAVLARAASVELNDFLLSHCQVHIGGLTSAERLGVLSLTVVGGYEPLAIGLASALHLLLERPGVLELVRSDPALVPGAVDEALRLESPIPFTARVCVGGYRLGSVELPAGAAVLALLGAANRDPAVFAEPDVFDPRRSPNPHLALGGGPHFCLGAPLVRRSIATMLGLLLRERPDLRPAPEQAARWRTSLVPRGLVDLPVLW